MERFGDWLMLQILLLDRDSQYSRQVCSQINSRSDHLQCFDQTTYKNSILLARQESINAADLSSLQISWDSTLVIYDPQHFHNPPKDSYILVLYENPAQVDSKGVGIYKYGSLTAILEIIELFLRKNPLLLSALTQGTNLMCVLGAACPTIRQNWIDKLKQEKLKEGLKVVQIDLCPPYFGDCSLPVSIGHSLSDAFLRLMANDLSHEELGIFLIPKADGTLLFRPIERADDLLECSPDHLRQFVELIRKWIIYTNNQHFVIIQCYAIPFSFVYSITVLCDQLVLINQENSSLKTNAYNKELGYLLSNLPGSCNVEEILVPCERNLL